MTVKHNGTMVEPVRKFITGKGEYLGRDVKKIKVNAIQPPVDAIFKSMITLLAVVALGFYVGYRGSNWIG